MQSRALVVGYDRAECELIQSVLASEGLDSLVLNNGGEAQARLREEKFSVTLFDLGVSTPNGVELTRQMRASGINLMTPIVLISDDQRTSAVTEGFAAGASLVLYKPIDKTRLVRLVRATQGAIEHEKRRFRRVAVQSKVKLGLGQDRSNEWEAETIDVSLNGMLVKSSEPLPTGSNVRFSLFLSPPAKPIVGSGSVVRVLSGNQLGIRLNPLPMAESGRLQELLLPFTRQ
jgi:DNA-binding response OmpR family regulator